MIMNQRTRGKPRPLIQFGSPPNPPPLADEGEDHNHEEDVRFVMSSISAAPPGWVARYSHATVPLVAFSIVDVICSHGHVSDSFTDGLILRPGWTIGPQPAGWYEGENDDQFGKFLGFFPTDG
jgi:hypothetical protein